MQGSFLALLSVHERGSDKKKKKKKAKGIMNEHRRARKGMTHPLVYLRRYTPPPLAFPRPVYLCVQPAAASLCTHDVRRRDTCATARRAYASPSRLSKFSRASSQARGPSAAVNDVKVLRAHARGCSGMQPRRQRARRFGSNVIS